MIFAKRLDRIHMHIGLRIFFFDHPGQRCNILHCTDLVIHVHHGYNDRIFPHSIPQLFRINTSLLIHRQARHSKALLFQKIRHRTNRRMLHGCHHDMISGTAVCHSCTDQRPVVGFRAAGGIVDFLFLYL